MTKLRLPGSTDGVEIALEAFADDPAPDNPARAVLERQRRLIDAQIAQLGRQRWRDVIVTMFGVGLLVAVGLFVWSTTRAGGVVVQPFAVPPVLETRGLSGPVVATQMLDKLTTMQKQTESLRSLSSYANNWGDDIKVEVPYAGVSIGELRRYLAAWLGDQTTLSGEVMLLPDGRIAVTSRVGASPPTRAEGVLAELDTLIGKNAEAVYSETQPYRYSVWLSRNGRPDEGDAVRQKLIAGTDVNDRLWGYNGLGANAPRYQDRMRYFRAALRVRPDFMPAIVNMRIAEGSWGHEEEAYRLAGDLIARADDLRDALQPGKDAYIIASARAARAGAEGDFAASARIVQTMSTMDTTANTLLGIPLTVATDWASARNVRAARQSLEEAGLDDPRLLAERESTSAAGVGSTDAVIAFALEDWPSFHALVARALRESLGAPRDRLQNDPTNFLRSFAAVGAARTGRFAEAIDTIRPTPFDCQPCIRTRGTVLALAGRHNEADRWFRLAVRQTPSLPIAHHDWADALLLRGDAAGAIAQAQIAARQGPRWADPLRIWGGALMLRRDYRAAADLYARAAALAPNWGALQLDWARALWMAGDRPAARGALGRASSLELSPVDRARLQRMAANAKRWT